MELEELYSYAQNKKGRVSFVLSFEKESLNFELTESNIKGKNYQVTLMSTTMQYKHESGKSLLLSGFVNGNKNDIAYFYIGKDYFRAIYSLKGKKWELRSVKGKDKRIIVKFRQSDLPSETSDGIACVFESTKKDQTNRGFLKSSESLCSVAPIIITDGIIRVFEVAAEVEYPFYSGWGSNVAQVEADVLMKMMAVDAVYSNYFDLNVQVVHLNIWVDPDDPYQNATTTTQAWYAAKGYWNQNLDCIQRDVVHLFLGRNLLQGCGVVVVPPFPSPYMCDVNVFDQFDRNTFSVSEHVPLSFFNTYKTIAHEFAHNLGHEKHTEQSVVIECAELCNSNSEASLLCQLCNAQENDFFTEPEQVQLWGLISSLSCLSVQSDGNNCEPCTPTVNMVADNTIPTLGCKEEDEIIKYEIEVCNACKENEIKVRIENPHALQDIFEVDPLFNPPVIPPNFSIETFTTDEIHFEPFECKTFVFKAKILQFGTLTGTVKTQSQAIIGGVISPDETVTLTNNSISIDGTAQPVKLSDLIPGTFPEPSNSCSNPPLRKIEVAGTFEIDLSEPYCFGNGTKFIFEPGSQILVKSGSHLNLEKVKLFACDQQWQGIRLEEGAHLTIDNSTIEDAQYAVRASGSSDIAITNSTFNRNFVGVYIDEPWAGYVGSTNFTAFSGNTFDGGGGLLPPYTGQGYDPAPGSGDQAFAGVWIQNASLPVHSMGNTFKNLSNGIYTRNTSLKVTACSFEDITENGYNSFLSGYGVQASTGKAMRLFQQSGFGGNPSDPPSFRNCSKAIKVTGMAVDYIKDNFMRVGKGIELVNNRQEVDVRGNLIQVNNSVGIEINQPPPSTDVTVALNDIEVSIFAINGTGIQLNAMGLDP